jgi:C_GCAxxG_C_C family probable redox protein
MGLVEALGIETTCVPRIATGFGAGIARHGDVCGAIAGGTMALGLVFGRDSADDAEAKEKTYSRVDRLALAFKAKFGHIRCRDLTGCDLRTPEGRERFAQENMHLNLCTKFVAFAAEETFHLATE